MEWFFRPPSAEPDALRAIWWWEARRIPYNLVVGIAGVVSLMLFYLFINLAHGLQFGEDLVEPIALFAAPIAINVCYTLGWITELLWRACGSRSLTIGPALLKIGVCFSLIVISIPSVCWCVVWIWKAIS